MVRPNALSWWRFTFRPCGIEAHLFVVYAAREAVIHAGGSACLCVCLSVQKLEETPDHWVVICAMDP